MHFKDLSSVLFGFAMLWGVVAPLVISIAGLFFEYRKMKGWLGWLYGASVIGCGYAYPIFIGSLWLLDLANQADEKTFARPATEVLCWLTMAHTIFSPVAGFFFLFLLVRDRRWGLIGAALTGVAVGFWLGRGPLSHDVQRLLDVFF